MKFDLFKRDKQIGRYSSLASAQVIANRLRGEERAQRFTIKKGKHEWYAMVPPIGGGRTKWLKSTNGRQG